MTIELLTPLVDLVCNVNQCTFYNTDFITDDKNQSWKNQRTGCSKVHSPPD